MKEKPTILQLSEHADAAKNALNLVSNAFEYAHHNDVQVDFYPILNKENWNNFYFIKNNNNVVASAAYVNKLLKTPKATLPITMIGAIATDANYQKRGYASALIEHIIALNKDSVGLIFLWSDLASLYSKFEFEQIGRQYVYKSKTQTSWIGPKTFHSLNDIEKSKIKILYKKYIQNRYCTIDRDDQTWNQIENISSALFYHSPSLDRYFVVHKGQDLTNIIHEYAFDPALGNKIFDFPQEFQFWSPEKIKEYPTEQELYSCLVRNANKDILNPFLFSLEIETENWRQIFSQTQYPFYISGLESV